MKTIMKLLMIGTLAALFVSVCGCTSNTQSPTSQSPAVSTSTPAAVNAVTKQSTAVTVVGSHSVSTADKVSKSGSQSFTATINPSAVCGDLQWNINGVIIGTSNGCGGSTLTTSIANQAGIQVGHTYQLTAYFAGNENYGSSYDTVWIYITS